MLIWPLLIALLLLIMIPFAPFLVRARIRVFGWLGWNWAANLLEEHFARWVWLVRIVLIGSVIVLVLLAFALAG